MSVSSSARVLGVMQREWGITNSTSKTPILGTPSLGPCVGLCLYNRTYKIASLAHIDSAVNLNSIQAIFDAMREHSEIKDLEVTLVGGWRSESFEDYQELVTFIQSIYKGSKLNTDYFLVNEEPDVDMDEEAQDINLVPDNEGFITTLIDSRTGKIFIQPYEEDHSDLDFFDYGSDAQERSDLIDYEIDNEEIDLPINLARDARQASLI